MNQLNISKFLKYFKKGFLCKKVAMILLSIARLLSYQMIKQQFITLF